MSDAENNFEAQSDSFWEIGQFKRTVKRTDDGYKLCNDLTQMLSERASLEKIYAKSLKGWSKKWNEYLEKSPEYGTMKASWSGMTTEAANLSDIHLQMHTDIEELLITEIKAWQKQNYAKTMMNTIKITKQYEEEFQKAQKPWAKKYLNVEKCKKEYHNQCKLLQTARIQETNSKNDAAISPDQRKKIEDKVEKLKKESDSAKHKYQQALDDLNEYNSRYIEDMKAVYKKCDIFEKQRLEFFIQKFLQAHSYLDLTKKEPINTIYTSFMNTIKGSNPDKDLLYWSKTHGAQMNMGWPTFEEYSEELRNISKSAKPQKLMDDNGITMVGIKQKEDQVPDVGASGGSGLRNSSLHNSRSSIQQTVAGAGAGAAPSLPQRADSYPDSNNPFNDDDFSDEDNINSTTTSSSHSNSIKKPTVSPPQPPPPVPKSKSSLSDTNRRENETRNATNDVSNPFDSDDDNTNIDSSHENGRHTAAHNNHSFNNNGVELNLKVRALYDYQSTEDDELTLKAGEVFTKLSHEDDRGWCRGKIGNKIGLYPATYAEDA